MKLKVPSYIIYKKKDKLTIKDLIRFLPYREYFVLENFFEDGTSKEDFARFMKISVEEVELIYERGIKAIKDFIRENDLKVIF